MRSCELVTNSIADLDPRSVAFFDHWIRDPGWVKRSRYGINIRDHNSESLETFFGLKYLSSLMRMRIRDPVILGNPDPGSGMEKIRIQDPGKTSRISNTGLTNYYFCLRFYHNMMNTQLAVSARSLLMFGPRTFRRYFLAWTSADFFNFCTSQCSLFDLHNSVILCAIKVFLILAKIDKKSNLLAINFEICAFEILNSICRSFIRPDI
jgi:hypothetical protein